MSNNKYRKPVLTVTEEFITSHGIFKRITTMYRRILNTEGCIVLDDYSLLEDEHFLDELKTKFIQEDFKGYIDFNDKKVPFEINLEVTDEEGNNVEFYKLGIQTKNYIFDKLIDAPRCCELKFNDYGRGHKYVLNDKTYEHTAGIAADIGKEKSEQIKAELTELATIFDSYN